MEMYDPPHPGRVVRAWMGDAITISALAKHLGMTRANLSMILNGRLGISALVALKLGDAFPKTDAKFWLTLQNHYDLAHARRKKRRKIAPVYPKAPVKPQSTREVALKKAAWTPLSYWLYFHLALVALLAAEYALHLAVPDTRRKAIYAIALWTTASLALAAVLVPHYRALGAQQYLASYALEQSLSIDNLFVFLLLFRLFGIPAARQPKVLFWGVTGAILMRGAFIAGGLSLLHRFAWISYFFAAILLIAAIRLVLPHNETNTTPRWITWLTRLQPVSADHNHFFVIENGRRTMTILFLALLAVELTDVVFALDSIPAVLSITRVPFLAYTSNIMAVMCLRSLYVLLAEALSRLRYLHFGLAAVLAFAALKMLLANVLDISPLLSLAIIAALLTVPITTSLLRSKANPRNLSSPKDLSS